MGGAAYFQPANNFSQPVSAESSDALHRANLGLRLASISPLRPLGTTSREPVSVPTYSA